MKYNVNFSEIVAQLVKVFKSEQMARDYNSEGEIFEGMCGWCGVMSPASRGAFVKAFGASVVLEAETKAREEIQAARERHNATHYHAHTVEADELQGVPAVGGFFWAANSGLKCDDGRGVFGEISALLWCTEEDDEHSRREFAKRPARLCQVREVFTVSPEEFDRPELADELVERHALQGGSASDDVDEGTTWQQLANDEEARATLYTFGALVTDGVRYYLIDSEGYNYSRYIYVPLSWQDNLGGIVKSERERIQARKEAEAKQEEEEKAARLAEYKSRCNKWVHLMEDVRPLEKKEAETYEAYTRTGWNSKSPEGKAHTAAKRATDAARKRNILAMCSAAFPGVKFSVSVHRGWGEDFRVTWQDGPTEEEFKAMADIDLFASCWDTFDGMTDCADVAYAEFTDFSALTMGDRCGGCVRADREISEQACAAVIAELVAVAPEYGSRDKYGYKRVTVTEEQAVAVAQRLGMSISVLYGGCYFSYAASADEIAYRCCLHTSFYKRQDDPTDPDPNRPNKGGKVQDTANDNTPADSLQLVEIPGGVAVVGDARTTYRNRREIKAHGGTWNKTAQRWEATEPEKVAQLRAWFAHDEQTSEATAEASTGAITEAGAPVEGQGVEATAETSTETDTKTGAHATGQHVEINAEGLKALSKKFAEMESRESTGGTANQTAEPATVDTPEEEQEEADTVGAPVKAQGTEQGEKVQEAQEAEKYAQERASVPEATNTEAETEQTTGRHDSTEAGDRSKVDTTAAPAGGLWLAEIAGGVAVVGDARTTYRNRREIKAHGATWNKITQLWEATEPEKVAQLRAWFAHTEQTAETTARTPTEADTPAGGQGRAESKAVACRSPYYSVREKSPILAVAPVAIRAKGAEVANPLL